MEDNNILMVKNEDGQDISIEVIDILENEETNKKYISYKLINTDDIYISELIDNDNSYVLETIVDENVLNDIKNYMLDESKEIRG